MRSTRLTTSLLGGICAVWLVGPNANVVQADVTFHVAVDGQDTNSGTADRPFATPARARDAVRAAIADGLQDDVTVWIGGGVYFLDQPLLLIPEDSGSNDHAITYAALDGETPVLSGGRPITGWTKSAQGLWAVTLPDVASGDWNFRELFVDGRRAVRARTPNATAEDNCLRLVDAKLTEDLASFTLMAPPNSLQAWSNLEDVEVIVLKNWATLHKRLKSVDPASGLVTLRPPHVKYFGGNQPRKNGGFFFENAIEMLDEPGEWYLDRNSGLLSYRPLPGQDMSTIEAIAPVLSRVLEIAGQPDRPVRNVRFLGLTIQHQHVPLPPEGHHGRQAAFRYGGDGVTGIVPGIVQWTHAENCQFVSGTVAHAGGSGIDLGEGCHHNKIEGNNVFDMAANGINLGGPNDEALAPRHNRITNNRVHHCGAVYYGACAIWAGFAQDTLIEHNLVHDHPYTGISIGWKWDESPTVARAYVVQYNHVYDVMREVCDGGCIYSLGFAPETVLRANHLHDVHRSRYAIAAPNNGIFFDQGSKGYLIVDNVIYRTAGRAVRHNQNDPKWHEWQNNVLIEGEPPEDFDDALLRVERAGLERYWQERLTP